MIISAQLPALSLVLAVAAVRVVEIPVVPDAQIAAWEPAKAIVLEAAEPAVEDALHPVHQAVRVIVAAPAGISATDRRIARFTMLAMRNGRMIPSPRRTPSVAILIPIKIKK